MYVEFFLIAMIIGIIVSLVTVFVMALYGNDLLVIICLFVTLFSCIFFVQYSIDRLDKFNEERAKVEEQWKAEGCWVYRYECGKSKYACEIKTNEKEKVVVGDQILKTYPTCK